MKPEELKICSYDNMAEMKYKTIDKLSDTFLTNTRIKLKCNVTFFAESSNHTEH